MHARLSTSIGMPVIDDSTGTGIGYVSGALIHPDTGVIEGFYVLVGGLLSMENLFVSSMDIVHWGTTVAVRSSDSIGPPDESIRLQPLLDDPRRVTGQLMRTESGKTLGKCMDIQFETKTWRTEWLFPKKWFRWGTPLPVTEVVEVKPEYIVMKDPLTTLPVKDELSSMDILRKIPEIAAEKGMPQPTTRKSGR